MAQKQPKSQKKIARSAREMARRKGNRPRNMAATRRRKLANAIQSCGQRFAEALQEYYKRTPQVYPRPHGR